MTPNKQRVQRISMRMYHHPVRHDGTIVLWENEGRYFDVEFDGPLPATRFWKYTETLVLTKEPLTNSSGGSSPTADAQIWEVLK